MTNNKSCQKHLSFFKNKAFQMFTLIRGSYRIFQKGKTWVVEGMDSSFLDIS